MDMRKNIVLSAVTLFCVAAHADLNKIDADGVTEVGGTAAYARMLPRTRSDGKLSASLLPPVSDWAAQPISGLYYVSGGATSEGNGSPQYPFKTLTYALANAASGSALLFSPATYSGTLSIGSGQSFTLCGFDSTTYVSAMTVTVSGDSSATTLTLCGMRVGTLTVNGGRINVRLTGTTVASLAGSSTAITVTRTDMGASVSAATVSYADGYAGYSVSPKAYAVTDTAGTALLTMSGGRAVVGSETVAYKSEITSATNAVYVTVGELQAEDARIAGLVTNEAAVRASADTALYAALSNAVTDLEGDIGGIGTGWNTQFSSLSSRLSSSLSSTRESLASLWVKETNDVATINTSIAGVQTAYAAADTTLESTLRGEFNSGLSTLRSDVPGIADTRADARIAVAKPTIVNTAVAQANSNANTRISALTTRVGTNESAIASLNTTVGDHTSSIATLTSTDIGLQRSINTLSAKEADDVISLSTSISGVQSAYAAADTELASTLRSETNIKLSNIITTINSIIDCLTAIQQNKSGTMSIPAKLSQ